MNIGSCLHHLSHHLKPSSARCPTLALIFFCERFLLQATIPMPRTAKSARIWLLKLTSPKPTWWNNLWWRTLLLKRPKTLWVFLSLALIFPISLTLFSLDLVPANHLQHNIQNLLSQGYCKAGLDPDQLVEELWNHPWESGINWLWIVPRLRCN